MANNSSLKAALYLKDLRQPNLGWFGQTWGRVCT